VGAIYISYTYAHAEDQNNAHTAFLVNNASFEAPTVPVLLQILSGAKNASDLVPAGSIYELAPNKSVELTIPGGAIGGPVSIPYQLAAILPHHFGYVMTFLHQHPVHLHGHSFSVVRSAGNSSYNFDNPVIRDVVSIGNTGDNVTIRFFTDNPGPWFFHCHIDWHLNAFVIHSPIRYNPDAISQWLCRRLCRGCS
jgi:iron transport multicopper oxidase